MNSSRDSKFSASESELGYLYQLRYALFVAVNNVESDIAVETLDDVVVDSANEKQLLQLKHHIKPGNLTDRSSDLWHSIRIWADLIQRRQIDLSETRLFLVTTGTAASASVANLLTPGRSGTRDFNSALLRLREIARESTNSGNQEAYNAFNRLSSEQQLRLVENIEVLDKAIPIGALDIEIKKRLKLAVPDQFVDDLFERVEGWWYSRVILSLESPSESSIRAIEIRTRLHELQSEYYPNNLPIHFVDEPPPLEDGFLPSQRVFIDQLRLIMVNEPRILRAIAEYYRAYKQRSKWLEDGNILISELSGYEKRLIDEWSRVFLIQQEDLEEVTDPKERAVRGRTLFNALEGRTDLLIRPRCDQPYVMRGTLHHLSNDLRVGWHPDFVDRLKSVIETAEEQTR